MSAPIHLPDLREGQPAPREYMPVLDHLVTEDDTPVDNIYTEKQMRLWTEALYASWHPPEPYMALANVGLYYKESEPAIVPDTMVVRGVSMPSGDPLKKEHRSYFVWFYGKPPDAALELVSNTEGGEDSRKLDIYARVGVTYCVIWDPARYLKRDRLRLLALHEGLYVPIQGPILKQLGLGLSVWHGKYEEMEADWLRWTDPKGQLLLTGAERATLEMQHAEAERQRAEAEKQRADSAELRAESLAAKLRSLGVDPNGGEA